MWARLPEKRGYPGAAERKGRRVKRTESKKKTTEKDREKARQSKKEM